MRYMLPQAAARPQSRRPILLLDMEEGLYYSSGRTSWSTDKSAARQTASALNRSQATETNIIYFTQSVLDNSCKG